MKVSVGCHLTYLCSGPVSLVLAILPWNKGNGQRLLQESLQTEPALDREYFEDLEGNRLVRLQAGAGELQIHFEGEVEVTEAPEQGSCLGQPYPGLLPAAVLPYLYPSRYCPSDRLVRFALGHFDRLGSALDTVTGIRNWIHDSVEYSYSTTDSHTSASDTLIERIGVCRDFAHLGIALCRALGIPARFVACYACKLDPPDFHAVFEAYLVDRWVLFDATGLAPLDGLVRIATGRDAADTAFANLYGPVAMQGMEVWSRRVDERPVAFEFPVRGG